MASTVQAERLTDRQRAEQLAIRASSLRELVELWRTVDVTNLSGTIDNFARAAALLAGQGYRESAESSARYYRLFRTAEGVPGAAPRISPARPPANSVLAGQLRGSALAGIINARRAGVSPQVAGTRGLARALGALAKLVLTGGRMTLMSAAEQDPQAIGWGRVASGGACAFCRALVGRGPKYKTERSANFESHDGCGCTAEPVFRGDADPESGQATQYRKEFAAAQAWARESGTLSDGTSNDALNNYRRYLSAGKPTAGTTPVKTEESGNA
jgi:hypothetical protein